MCGAAIAEPISRVPKKMTIGEQAAVPSLFDVFERFLDSSIADVDGERLLDGMSPLARKRRRRRRREEKEEKEGEEEEEEKEKEGEEEKEEKERRARGEVRVRVLTIEMRMSYRRSCNPIRGLRQRRS